MQDVDSEELQQSCLEGVRISSQGLDVGPASEQVTGSDCRGFSSTDKSDFARLDEQIEFNIGRKAMEAARIKDLKYRMLSDPQDIDAMIELMKVRPCHPDL